MVHLILHVFVNVLEETVTLTGAAGLRGADRNKRSVDFKKDRALPAAAPHPLWEQHPHRPLLSGIQTFQMGHKVQKNKWRVEKCPDVTRASAPPRRVITSHASSGGPETAAHPRAGRSSAVHPRAAHQRARGDGYLRCHHHLLVRLPAKSHQAAL